MTGTAVGERKGFLEGIRRYGGQIAYYGGIALALTALAFAAEQYRNRIPEPITPVLPAVELTAPVEAGEEAEPAFYAPDGAEILRAYAAEPEWNAALRFWESHAAIDYRLDGGIVTSMSEGVVRKVGKSGVYGGFVEIECGEYLLRYASIEPNAKLVPGDVLKTGDFIGTANASMVAESGLGAHLHLEVLCREVYQNFETLCDFE